MISIKNESVPEFSKEKRIEKILGRRIKDGKKEFLVKWKGLSENCYTWLPINNDRLKIWEEITNSNTEKIVSQIISNEVPMYASLLTSKVLAENYDNSNEAQTYVFPKHLNFGGEGCPLNSVCIDSKKMKSPFEDKTRKTEENNCTSSMSEDEYIVEKILDRKVCKGKVKYLVKWEGYEEPTWIKEENMLCNDLIKKFEAERKSLSKKTNKKNLISKTSRPRSNEKSVEMEKLETPEKTNSPTFIESSNGTVREISKYRREGNNLKVNSSHSIEREESKESKTPPRSSDSSKTRQKSISQERSTEKRIASRRKRDYTTPEAMSSGSDTGILGRKKAKNAERIIGASVRDEELMFLVKWEGSDLAEWIPARVANISWPQVVITYYEDRLIWNTSGAESTPR